MKNNTENFTYKIDESTGIVTKIYSGFVTKHDVMESWNLMGTIKVPAKFKGLIIDYNGAVFNFEPIELEEIAQYFKKINNTIHYNVATICVKPIHYVLSTLVEHELTGNTNTTKTFSTAQGAVNYLMQQT